MDNTKTSTKNFDYTTIADRLWTVSCSNLNNLQIHERRNLSEAVFESLHLSHSNHVATCKEVCQEANIVG